MNTERLIIKCLSLYLLLLLPTSSLYANTPYAWYAFNIPPFGSISEQGIGFTLADAYINAGFDAPIVLINTARWQSEMMDPGNDRFCTTGSWKLPNTEHRVYSNSILNTVDYGVAVRSDLYRKLSQGCQRRKVSINKVIDSTRSGDRLLILNDRPVFGVMGKMIDEGTLQSTTNIDYMTASEGPISMMKMANMDNRKVASVLVFPEEFFIFEKEYPQHNLEYLMLEEGVSFAPIRASCPDTEMGRSIISTINSLLDQGLRDKVFSLFKQVLPNIIEIQQQAEINQACIKNHACIDPLVGTVNRFSID
jgi:hypothetical protein